jgi:fatty-acyl-CoA synthase
MEHQPLTDPPLTEQPYLARRQNWTNQLARHALMQPDATALRFLGHTTTSGELDRRVTALAGALSRRGVGFGDRVMVLMLNRTEFIESFLAANRLGAIAVPVNFRMTPPEIAFLVSDCQAQIVITEAVLAKVATAVREIDPTLKTVIVAGGSTDDEVIGYDDLIAEVGAAGPDPIDIPNDSPALIMYTSGTTGRPKGAVLTHTNLSGQAMTNLFTIPILTSVISINSSPNGWRGTSIRRRWRSSTRCRATPPAKYSRRNCERVSAHKN